MIVGEIHEIIGAGWQGESYVAIMVGGWVLGQLFKASLALSQIQHFHLVNMPKFMTLWVT